MRSSLAAFLLLGLSAVAAAAPELPMGGEAWQGMSRGVAAYKARNAPVAVDPAPVRRLWRDLARRGAPITTGEGEDAVMFERSAVPDAEGRAANRQVYLVELPGPEEGPVSRAVYTRRFSHLVATSEDWSRGPSGERRVEIWRFVVGLEGTLFSAVRQEIVLKDPRSARGQSEVDESRSRSIPQRPSDPSVQKRWKELSAELLRLGPVVEI